ncbi:hypothetical protein HanPI659440_Chr01g0004041 [Helianthus annuus]|nr:hypothetical protein HanPI659440_Chr01g0004041 [Helianthus annuus]
MSAKPSFPLFSALFLLSHTMHLISSSFDRTIQTLKIRWMLPFNDSIEKTLKSFIALHCIASIYSDSSLSIVDLLNQINLKVYLLLIHRFHLFSEYSEDLCSHVLCFPL